MSQAVFERIKKLLDDNGMEYELFHHEKVITSKDAAEIRGTRLEEAAKAIVMKSDEGFVMFVIPGHLKGNWKKIKKVLGTKKVRMATPEEVLEVTDCEVGSVPPFGNLFEIPVYEAEWFKTQEFVVFSTGTHYDSIKMKREDWERAVGAVSYSICDF